VFIDLELCFCSFDRKETLLSYFAGTRAGPSIYFRELYYGDEKDLVDVPIADMVKANKEKLYDDVLFAVVPNGTRDFSKLEQSLDRVRYVVRMGDGVARMTQLRCAVYDSPFYNYMIEHGRVVEDEFDHTFSEGMSTSVVVFQVAKDKEKAVKLEWHVRLYGWCTKKQPSSQKPLYVTDLKDYITTRFEPCFTDPFGKMLRCATLYRGSKDQKTIDTYVKMFDTALDVANARLENVGGSGVANVLKAMPSPPTNEAERKANEKLFGAALKERFTTKKVEVVVPKTGKGRAKKDVLVEDKAIESSKRRLKREERSSSKSAVRLAKSGNLDDVDEDEEFTVPRMSRKRGRKPLQLIDDVDLVDANEVEVPICRGKAPRKDGERGRKPLQVDDDVELLHVDEVEVPICRGKAARKDGVHAIGGGVGPVVDKRADLQEVGRGSGMVAEREPILKDVGSASGAARKIPYPSIQADTVLDLSESYPFEVLTRQYDKLVTNWKKVFTDRKKFGDQLLAENPANILLSLSWNGPEDMLQFLVQELGTGSDMYELYIGMSELANDLFKDVNLMLLKYTSAGAKVVDYRMERYVVVQKRLSVFITGVARILSLTTPPWTYELDMVSVTQDAKRVVYSLGSLASGKLGDKVQMYKMLHKVAVISKMPCGGEFYVRFPANDMDDATRACVEGISRTYEHGHYWCSGNMQDMERYLRVIDSTYHRVAQEFGEEKLCPGKLKAFLGLIDA
jgi:hypothetical protein